MMLLEFYQDFIRILHRQSLSPTVVASGPLLAGQEAPLEPSVEPGAPRCSETVAPRLGASQQPHTTSQRRVSLVASQQPLLASPLLPVAPYQLASSPGSEPGAHLVVSQQPPASQPVAHQQDLYQDCIRTLLEVYKEFTRDSIRMVIGSLLGYYQNFNRICTRIVSTIFTRILT